MSVIVRGLVAAAIACSSFLAGVDARAQEKEESTSTNDDAPLRRGLTVEAGAGVGGTHVASERSSEGGVGLALPSIGAGFFASSWAAILLRISGTAYRPEGGSLYGSTFYGLSIQFWPTDRLMLGIGPGVSAYSRGYYSVSGSNPKFGFGASLRAGYALVATKSAVFRVGLEAMPARIEKVTTFGSSLLLEWQVY